VWSDDGCGGQCLGRCDSSAVVLFGLHMSRCVWSDLFSHAQKMLCAAIRMVAGLLFGTCLREVCCGDYCAISCK